MHMSSTQLRKHQCTHNPHNINITNYTLLRHIHSHMPPHTPTNSHIHVNTCTLTHIHVHEQCRTCTMYTNTQIHEMRMYHIMLSLKPPKYTH